MGTWSTAIKGNDTSADIYDEFFNRYNSGEEAVAISQKLVESNPEIYRNDQDGHNILFALALAQWETKSLDEGVLKRVEDVISAGADLEMWREAGATEKDIQQRRVILDDFLEKIKLDRPKVKPRKRPKQRTPIFSTGDCLVFKMKTGYYGGAVVLATDNNSGAGYNLVATTRINQIAKPTLTDFEDAEVLVLNFAKWSGTLDINWLAPNFYTMNYATYFENIGKIDVEIDYSVKNYSGEGYLFKPSYGAAWVMNTIAENQFESEQIKPKPVKTCKISQLTLRHSNNK